MGDMRRTGALPVEGGELIVTCCVSCISESIGKLYAGCSAPSVPVGGGPEGDALVVVCCSVAAEELPGAGGCSTVGG